MAIICERFFVFDTHGRVECKKCRNYFLPLPGFPQNPCSTDFSRFINPDAIVLSAREFSWLPMSGMLIFALGLLECLDALLAKEQRDAIQNLQVGVLDTVVGALIFLSVSGTIYRLSLMIAAFLMVRGIVRIILAYALELLHKISTSMGGVVSIILGFLVFQEWPTANGWFISLSLNIEIAFRGWTGITFALWVRRQQNSVSDKKKDI